MKTSIRIAALVLGGMVFIGCSGKDDSTAPTAPATTATPAAPAAPAMPDTSKVGAAVDNAVDKGAAAAKTEADKLMANAPTTAPSMPAMPAMPK